MMRSHHRGLLLCQDVVANGGISSPQSKLLNFVTKLIFVEIVDYHSSEFLNCSISLWLKVPICTITAYWRYNNIPAKLPTEVDSDHRFEICVKF